MQAEEAHSQGTQTPSVHVHSGVNALPLLLFHYAIVPRPLIITHIGLLLDSKQKTSLSSASLLLVCPSTVVTFVPI
jgi:hypothetical protein